jgi:hypothetical protein
MAAPVMLDCAEASDGPMAMPQSYQITYDDLTSQTTIDGGTPVIAQITDTLIMWQADGKKWRIDRQTGLWSAKKVGGVNDGQMWGSGFCTTVKSKKTKS